MSTGHSTRCRERGILKIACWLGFIPVIASQPAMCQSELDARLALQKIESEIDSTRPAAFERFKLLPDLAVFAAKSGDLRKANELGEEILISAERYRKMSSAYGNALFYGHFVAGWVALSRGDEVGAAKELLRAGETPGSPVLRSYGPDMSLAKRMLDSGDRKTVIAFLRRCQSFWPEGAKRLEEWIGIIEHGGTPEFGANLVYRSGR